jgi:hypothetical protein
MIYIFFKKKIITGLLTGGILLSSVSITFAATPNPLNINRMLSLSNESIKIGDEIHQALPTNFKNVVTGNTITQTEANRIKSVLNKADYLRKTSPEKTKDLTEREKEIYINSNKIKHINPLTSLVNNGTITQDQADKIIMKQLYLCQSRVSQSFL